MLQSFFKSIKPIFPGSSKYTFSTTKNPRDILNSYPYQFKGLNIDLNKKIKNDDIFKIIP